ncbi:uncharacterized protein LOC115767425 [Drosophila novamexicana]|uniref:uncharacterized protein LOC115767425 n=1 Tax=Drosophila novamexicana TaxID=47314 RepID=UPI0011E5A398|nr:uncharacterized protein LOC115767425 [Drosophila novamexicana]
MIWIILESLYKHCLQARSVSVSLNMSLTRSEPDERNETMAPAKLNQELLQSCMRETDVSMSQLKFFRLSLLFNDNNNGENELALAPGDGADAEVSTGNNLPDLDYGNATPFLDLKRNEPLQCFVRCLYESLGLVHYDMMLEEAFRMQLQGLMQRLKPELKECKDMSNKNRCEAAYKLHVCYNHLKNLETEQRLREVLERSETGGDLAAMDNEENENENVVSEADKANEISQRFSETTAQAA